MTRLMIGLGLLGLGYYLGRAVEQGRRIQCALDESKRSERLEPHRTLDVPPQRKTKADETYRRNV